jgi:hypothetical protein
MKHISIGALDVSRIGLGAMSMSGYYNIGAGSDGESIRAIHRALDLGVSHLDTAEIYEQSAPRLRAGSPGGADLRRPGRCRGAMRPRPPRQMVGTLFDLIAEGYV